MQTHTFLKRTLLGASSLMLCATQCKKKADTPKPNDQEKVTVTYEVNWGTSHVEEGGVHKVDKDSAVTVTAKLEGSEEAKKAVKIEWATEGNVTATAAATTWTYKGNAGEKVKLTAKAVYTDEWKDKEDKPEIVNPEASYEIHWVDFKAKAKAVKDAFDAKELSFSVADAADVAFADGDGSKEAILTFNALTITNNSGKALDMQHVDRALKNLKITAYVAYKDGNRRAFLGGTGDVDITSMISDLGEIGDGESKAIAPELKCSDNNKLRDDSNPYFIYWAVFTDSKPDLGDKNTAVENHLGGTITLKTNSNEVDKVEQGVKGTGN